MNKYTSEVRKRNQTLLIVEGNHEKNELFWLIFKCFPEIHISMDNVWIYGTNIYMLYEDIVKEYGSDWVENEDDIDLPYIISKKKQWEALRYKINFTNIVLVFDYERHDTGFAEQKIVAMQNYFTDATDMGRLYINYPMIESYQHLKALPDTDYAERKIPTTMQPGREYKALVKKESIIGKYIEFPHRVDSLLREHYGVCDELKRLRCCNEILNISDKEHIEILLLDALKQVITDARIHTAKYQFMDWMKKLGYVCKSQTYWQQMRELFQQIIHHNICKANRIQNNCYRIKEDQYKECFENLDFTEILKLQNLSSQDSVHGFIWVLNTCVLFVAEYNFALLSEYKEGTPWDTTSAPSLADETPYRN